MLINTLVLGAYENNCYVLRSGPAEKTCLIIDTGLDVDPLMTFLQGEALQPQALVFTHGHGDHIAGARALLAAFPQIQIAVHRNDVAALSCPHTNLAAMVGEDITSPPPHVLLDDDMTIGFAGIDLAVLHTPGHSPGGVCLYNAAENVLFSGDTLFAGSVGRTDFPTSRPGDHEMLIDAIRTRLLTLPPETKVFPGHGPSTTIRNELRHNPFLQP